MPTQKNIETYLTEEWNCQKVFEGRVTSAFRTRDSWRITNCLTMTLGISISKEDQQIAIQVIPCLEKDGQAISFANALETQSALAQDILRNHWDVMFPCRKAILNSSGDIIEGPMFNEPIKDWKSFLNKCKDEFSSKALKAALVYK